MIHGFYYDFSNYVVNFGKITIYVGFELGPLRGHIFWVFLHWFPLEGQSYFSFYSNHVITLFCTAEAEPSLYFYYFF